MYLGVYCVPLGCVCLSSSPCSCARVPISVPVPAPGQCVSVCLRTVLSSCLCLPVSVSVPVPHVCAYACVCVCILFPLSASAIGGVLIGRRRLWQRPRRPPLGSIRSCRAPLPTSIWPSERASERAGRPANDRHRPPHQHSHTHRHTPTNREQEERKRETERDARGDQTHSGCRVWGRRRAGGGAGDRREGHWHRARSDHRRGVPPEGVDRGAVTRGRQLDRYQGSQTLPDVWRSHSRTTPRL